MPDEYCFVCASNEGVFLDVTPENQETFGDQVETCLSTKISECIDLSNKICYKCAYELDQSAKFVQKYKRSHKVSEPKAVTSMPCCFLCYELVDSDRIFDISKDNNVIFNPLRKIRSIFSDDISKNSDLKLICLPCRYNLDVLYDLKRVYQETIVNLKALINEEINYSNFPKVHTDVVNRKTTITTFPDITFYGSVNSSDNDSDDEDMARGKRHVKGHNGRSKGQIKMRNKTSRIRHCDKCYKVVANGVDMYRFYRTGLTVCKNCWITIDPSSDKTRRCRQVQGQSNFAETKWCTVFLTDVLSQELYRKKKVHEVKKNKDDNMSYDSSQEEAKSSESSPLSVPSKTKNHINGKAQGKKRRIDTEKSKDDVEHTPAKVTKLNKDRTSTNEMKSMKASVDAEQQSSTYVTRRQTRKRTIDDKSSESDNSLEQGETHRNTSRNLVKKTNKKKQKSILEETTSNVRLDDSSDETSNEDGKSSGHKTRGAMSSLTAHIKKETEKKEEERNTRSRTRSSSISSTEMTSLTEFKSPKSLAQLDIKTEYACDKCNKKFDTKLSNAKHRLTHLKQAALKLEKLTVPSVKEKQETEDDKIDSQDDNISKEAASRSDRTRSAKKQTLPSKEIASNIEDDTDNEEIFNLSTKESVKKKVVKAVSGEDDNVIDKPDTAKNESRIEEESGNDGNIEIKKSEQCEESTVMPDETVTLETEIEDDKDRQNKDTRDTHTTKDKDKISEDRDSDKSKDKDAQKTDVATVENHNIDKEKDKKIENDAKVLSAEKEKTISEHSNNDEGDEGDLQEEIIYDGETIRSSILSIHNTTKDNKDHSENYKNNLKTNCEDDKDEVIEEPEISQYDLMNESSKKDTKEPEEIIHKILPMDKTEILIISDKTDLDDIIVNEDKIEELEEHQNWFDEENMEVEITVNVDKSNIKDTIEPDLSNSEKHDEIKDDDENDIDEDAVVSINSDSNDDKAKCKEIMEEMALTDDSKERRKLEEEIKELEELVEDNTMNNKYRKVQESSTYILNSSADTANEILKEVFELAAAEVLQREENSNIKSLDDVEMETLENISREIRKSADMPSLDPISVMEIDDDITLN